MYHIIPQRSLWTTEVEVAHDRSTEVNLSLCLSGINSFKLKEIVSSGGGSRLAPNCRLKTRVWRCWHKTLSQHCFTSRVCMPISIARSVATRTARSRFSLLKVHASPRALLLISPRLSSVLGQSSSNLRPFHTTTPSFKKKMPPKKKVVEEKKVILGRPGNNLKVCLFATLAVPCSAR